MKKIIEKAAPEVPEPPKKKAFSEAFSRLLEVKKMRNYELNINNAVDKAFLEDTKED